MTMAEVCCKAVAMQNSSQWPCSMHPIPQLRYVGVRISYIFFFLIFPGHLEFWTPLQIPIWGPPLGCTLLQYSSCFDSIWGVFMTGLAWPECPVLTFICKPQNVFDSEPAPVTK